MMQKGLVCFLLSSMAISAWAYAGNAEKAKDGLIHRFTHNSPHCRFPIYSSQMPDSCPDLNHFGAGSVALQRMQMQTVDDKIFLLPSWPKEWDVDFKRHAPKNTTVEVLYRNGKIKKLVASPASRKTDIVLPD